MDARVLAVLPNISEAGAGLLLVLEKRAAVRENRKIAKPDPRF